MVALRNPRINFLPNEYLLLERAADYKSEYIDGRIYAMSGGSPEHNRIATNITGELHTRLKGTSCQEFNSDQKVRTGRQKMFAYPDVTVACGRLVFHDATGDVLVNPVVLVEVLSPSTEDEDRGVKWMRYQTIKSLQHYLLVSQDEPVVELFTRDADGDWQHFFIAGLDKIVPLSAINVILPLSEIYYLIEFTAEPE